MKPDFEVSIVGAGAAGLLAAITAARRGCRTAIFEKNTVAGRKLQITGGGRCNITNMLAPKKFADACAPFGKFLIYSIYQFPPQETINLLDRLNIKTQCQEDGCVFIVDQSASDFRDILVNEAKNLGVKFFYDKPAENITKCNGIFTICHKGKRTTSKTVIIATGGKSYPKTGSNGDGYTLAESFGHTLIAAQACLVPLRAKDSWVSSLAGVSVKQASLTIDGEKKKTAVKGAVIFTNDGIGGPAVLNFSRKILPMLKAGNVDIQLDLLAEKTEEQLKQMLNLLCLQNPKKELTALLQGMFPKSLTLTLSQLAQINPATKAGQLSKQNRQKLILLIKSLKLTISGTKPIEQATVTRGGVSNIEIDDKTMQSKLTDGLFFAGEVIDVDGPCGGFNLQIAFSTAVLAANAAADFCKKKGQKD